MKNDGTAEYHNYDDLEYVFKYTWDTSKNEVYMKVESILYDDGTLLNYNRLLSKLTIDELKKNLEDSYKKNKDEDWFEEDYPGCKNYDDYEKFIIEESGCTNLEEFFKLEREYYLKYLNSIFGAKVTYGYELNGDGKMTLTEKFTGVKNLVLYVSFYYKDTDGTSVEIEPDKEKVYIYLNGVRWYGEFGTGKTIKFEEEDSKEKKDGSYTEDIDKGTVTVHFDGKDYPCKFRGRNFIQVDE